MLQSESYSLRSLYLQYAVFLCLVFMTELIAGISGFIFRHEVTAVVAAAPHSHRYIRAALMTYYVNVDVCVYF